MLLVRLGAWIVHAFFDGVLIAGADSVRALLLITFSIGLCGLVDVGVLLHQLKGLGIGNRAIVGAIVAFGIGFPAGALFTLRVSTAIGMHILRMLSAGIFFYMGTFELAPPHTHGRANALVLVYLPFVAGAMLAYVA
jgi:hypothetical protein